MSKFNVVGVDVFVTSSGLPKVKEKIGSLKLILISNRGAKVWPGKCPPLDMTDHFCLRFYSAQGETATVEATEILSLLADLDAQGLQWNHVEKLYHNGSKPLFT